jgi:peptidoglycan/xylan/chitin deacetylase (PgdA/CDA1 family)
MALASHTWSHPNLCRIARERVDQELRLPLEWLQARFDRVVNWMSYPYGISSPEIESLVQESGYEGALRVEGGWLTGPPVSQSFRLPRFNVPAGISLDGFALRLAGLFCH